MKPATVPPLPESTEDLSGQITQALTGLNLFETVAVERWFRVWTKKIPYRPWIQADPTPQDGYIVAPDDPFLASPKRDHDKPPEEVYVGWFSRIYPEDKKRFGACSTFLTQDEKDKMQAALPEGLKLDPPMPPRAPMQRYSSQAPNVKKNRAGVTRDRAEGRSRGFFRIETDAVRRKYLAQDLQFAESFYHKKFQDEGEDDLKNMLKEEMKKIQERFGDLMDQEESEG